MKIFEAVDLFLDDGRGIRKTQKKSTMPNSGKGRRFQKKDIAAGQSHCEALFSNTAFVEQTNKVMNEILA